MSSNNYSQGHLVKMEWLIPNVMAVGSPGRAERAISGVFVTGRVFGQSRSFCGRGATLWCTNPLLSSNNFTWGRLMKIEWLVNDVTASGSSGRAEHVILGVILAGCVFGQFRPYLWSLSHFLMLEPSLEP